MLPLLPIVAGLTGVSGVSWIAKNVIGTDWLENIFTPKISTPKNTVVNANFSSYTSNLYHFRIQILAPSDKDIKALDDFFESYGYRVNIFGTPNLKVRGNFTFIKTRDAVVKSSNINAANQLASMLNNGCKFWSNEIG